MFNLEFKYNEIENDLTHLFNEAVKNIRDISDELDVCMAYDNLKSCIEKAKLYEINKFRCSQGGKKSAKNMTKKERIERAKKASRSRKN